MTFFFVNPTVTPAALHAQFGINVIGILIESFDYKKGPELPRKKFFFNHRCRVGTPGAIRAVFFEGASRSDKRMFDRRYAVVGCTVSLPVGLIRADKTCEVRACIM